MLSQRGHVTFMHAGVTKVTVRCWRDTGGIFLRPSSLKWQGDVAERTPHTQNTYFYMFVKAELIICDQHWAHAAPTAPLIYIFSQPLAHNLLFIPLGRVIGCVYMCSEPCPSSRVTNSGGGGGVTRTLLHLVQTSLYKHILGCSKCTGICLQDLFFFPTWAFANMQN